MIIIRYSLMDVLKGRLNLTIYAIELHPSVLFVEMEWLKDLKSAMTTIFKRMMVVLTLVLLSLGTIAKVLLLDVCQSVGMGELFFLNSVTLGV